jgi:hypothetical protein
MASANNLQRYLENDVRDKLYKEISLTLNQMEADILKRYPKITPERINQVLDKAKVEFIDQVTDMLELKLDVAFRDIASLNESVAKIKEDSHYQTLDREKIGEVENLLIESMLELAIYHINPDKGNMPTEGGAR